MSVAVMTWVFNHSQSKGSARLVLLAMADEAANTGELSAYRRSQSWIAKKANVTVRSVRDSIDALVALGELEVLREGIGKTQSDYRIMLREEQISSLREEPASAPAEQISSPSSRSLSVDPVSSCPTASNVDERFAKFWDLYPRKESKKAAHSAFKSMIKRKDLAHAQAALPKHMKMWVDQQRETTTIPLAASWLNGQRYFDVLPGGTADAPHRLHGTFAYRSDGTRITWDVAGNEIEAPE